MKHTFLRRRCPEASGPARAAAGTYLLEANLQVVLRLLLIVGEGLVDQELLLHVDLEPDDSWSRPVLSSALLTEDGGGELTSRYGRLWLLPRDTNVTSLTTGISP